MGFFSWKTSDTKRSICNNSSTRKPFTVHMITKDGQIFTEHDYEGYGEFGGKDIYVLAAEMNGHKGATDEETRSNFFDKIWKRGIEKDGKRYYYREDFNVYSDLLESEGNLSPNDLVSEHGWKHFGSDNDLADFAAEGFDMPKLVEKLPSTEKWAKEWLQLPYPESCKDQGYFYDEFDGEDFDDEEYDLDDEDEF